MKNNQLPRKYSASSYDTLEFVKLFVLIGRIYYENVMKHKKPLV